ncbi:cysteine-rich VLP protein [Caldibacillus debilis]|uniref:cysteine-rich VLP protein n=1 Tax=Caldibacillus debilis TaxID=301148 RepID=UPI00077914D5|nr:cysteine-rich VLP protein [Caldibacillus debilis]
MNQRKIRSLQSRLARLARQNCANYEGGECLIQPCGQCIVEIETDRLPANVCPYFMQAVLPADPALMDEYLDYFPRGYPLKKEKQNLKPCERCGELFEKRSNAAKYCDHCRKLNERDKARARKQKQRALSRNRNARTLDISTFSNAKIKGSLY